MYMSKEEWEEFSVSWEQYKEEYSLDGAGLIRQLVASCSVEVRRSLSRMTGARHFTLTEEELLRMMRELVVNWPDPTVSVQQLLGLSRDQGESVPHYLSRLRALASQSDLSVTCPSCRNKVSYSHSLVRHKLAASLGQKEILTTSNLDQTVLEIEEARNNKDYEQSSGTSEEMFEESSSVSDLRIISVQSLCEEKPGEDLIPNRSRQKMKECYVISQSQALQSVEPLEVMETIKSESFEDDDGDDDDDDYDYEEDRKTNRKRRKINPKLRIFRPTNTTQKCHICSFRHKKGKSSLPPLLPVTLQERAPLSAPGGEQEMSSVSV